MKIAVGIFAILFTVVFTASALIILREKGLFEKKSSFAFYADNASCFSLGTPIKYAGFKIGSIERIELTYDGKVFAHFNVSNQYRYLVNRKSYLVLARPLIGSPLISLTSEPNNTMLHPHAILQFTVHDDINDLVTKFAPIVKKLEEIITNIDTITTRIADPNSPFFQTLKNIEKTSHKFASNDSMIAALTGEKESTKNIVSTIKTLKKSMEEVEKITIEINKVLGEANKNILKPSKDISKNINDILLDVKHKLKSLDSLINTVGSSDKDIELVKEQILLGMDKTNKLLEKVDALLQSNNKKVKLP
jgi:phospholipid/cholesterol/gamma-HCH transport system substrate-binding protein